MVLKAYVNTKFKVNLSWMTWVRQVFKVRLYFWTTLYINLFNLEHNKADNWEISKSKLLSSNFYNELVGFDPLKIKNIKLILLKSFIENREYKPNKIGGESLLGAEICQWTLEAFNFVK